MIHFLWLLIAGVAAWLALVFLEWLPYVAVTAVATSWFAWVLVSVLSPAVPDRSCPQCGEQGLVKIRRGEPGVRCESCSFHDEAMHVAYLDEW